MCIIVWKIHSCFGSFLFLSRFGCILERLQDQASKSFMCHSCHHHDLLIAEDDNVTEQMTAGLPTMSIFCYIICNITQHASRSDPAPNTLQAFPIPKTTYCCQKGLYFFLTWILSCFLFTAENCKIGFSYDCNLSSSPLRCPRKHFMDKCTSNLHVPVHHRGCAMWSITATCLPCWALPVKAPTDMQAALPCTSPLGRLCYHPARRKRIKRGLKRSYHAGRRRNNTEINWSNARKDVQQCPIPFSRNS